MADDTQDQVSDDSNGTDAPQAAVPEAAAPEAVAADVVTAEVVAAEVDAPDDASTADAAAITDPTSTHATSTDTTSTEPTGPQADTGRVARIVAALRKAHAEQAARSVERAAEQSVGQTVELTVELTAEQTAEPADSGTETIEPELPAPRRATSGVRSTAPRTPTLRWNPGARYRASQLANQPVPVPPAPLPSAPLPPVPPPPGPVPPVPPPPALAGRLFRGPARRTAVFEREIWYPSARSSRVPSDVGEALAAAVERYRKGSISTSGLVRAIGSAHAA
ncbi:hypothetical protein [Promicromonospora sp. NPDC090134]|uniref:hypothetical protein n=1 Tax=Promicromonospora sp. NPDC090134 TaxID=3364408 RepID=UPI003806EF8C